MSELYGMTYGGHGSHWDGCENVHWDCRIARMEQRISELEAERRWIPVSERLPEDKEMVLIYDSINSTILRGYHLSARNQWGNQWTAEYLYFHAPFYTQITHWMPLPQPPEEE